MYITILERGFLVRGDVLVLNSSYLPINVVDWKRAVCLVHTGKAEVLSQDNVIIRSPSTEIFKPTVVRLLCYNKIPNTTTKFNRMGVFTRDRFTCQYCGKKLPVDKLTVDHVTPKRFGGKTTWDNVVTCCVPCNTKKSDRTPQQSGMKLLSQPKSTYYAPYLMIKKMFSDKHLEKWAPYII